MITLKEFMEVVNYRVTEGSDYCWNCFGDNAYSLSAWNGIHGKGGWSANIVFDTQTQETYEVDICDYTNDRAYRIINSEYKQAYIDESDDRGELGNQAWDGVDFIDIDVDDDWIQKSLAIVAGEVYDTRVQMPVDFSDEDLLKYMKAAHELDITFNQYVEQALKAAIDKYDFGSNYEQRVG
jgi:hypothetical protein